MDNSCKVPEVKPITIKRFGTAGLVPTVPTTTDCNLWQKTDLKDGEFALNTVDDKLYIRSGNEIIELTNQSATGAGTVTSVGLNMPSAFAVANSPVTSSGTLIVTGAGTTNEYIRGDGSLATFPTLTGITSINSLTGAAQTLSTGTTGSDFNIVSTGTTHTFNIPTASSVNRGLLSSTDWSTFNNKVSTGAITSSGLTMSTSRLLGRGTAGTGAVEEITIGSGLSLTGTTLSATGGISGLGSNRFVYATSGTTIATDNDAYFDGTQIAFGTSSPIANVRTTILGTGTTSSTWALQIHNSTGTNNSLLVRDDGFVGINTNTPLLSLPIGSTINSFSVGIPTVANAGLNINDRGVAYRRDINGLVWLDYSNQNASGSPAVVIRMSNNVTQASATIAKTGNSYAANQFGNEPQSLVFLNKAPSNNRMKFSLLSQDAVTNSYFDWLTGDTGGNSLPSDGNVNGGVNQTSSVMRLMGSGSLLVGTTTEISSSILTLESTTKGFLPPRMTTAERDLISSPATGLTLYNTTTNTLDIKSSAASVFNRFGSETLIVGGGNTQATIALSVQNNSTNNNSFIVSDLGNIGIGTTSAGTSATKTLVINNGIAPTGDVTDSFQQYSADIVAGNAAPHFRTENGNIIKLYQETTGIAAAAFVANTSLIFDDSATYGGYTMGQVVAALKAQGLLA